MAVRLFKVVLVIPMCFLCVFIQLPMHCIRYIITGKSISAPWFSDFIFN